MVPFTGITVYDESLYIIAFFLKEKKMHNMKRTLGSSVIDRALYASFHDQNEN